MVNWGRRDFLKVIGLTGATAITSCSSESAKKLIPYVIPPEDIVPGKSTWYATTCRECPAGCGVLAKNREGRIIKVEGNPLHPINQGTLCIRGQAALQRVYSPDRIKTPLLRENNEWQPLSYFQAEALLKTQIEEAVKKGSDRVRLLTEPEGETLLKLFTECLHKWESQGPLVFEPYAYESLKAASQEVFGLRGLNSYRMEKADVVVSFGADFLETWLSPVEYARKFKQMHSLGNGKKGLFFHVSPVQSLTCANADLWLCCNPGGEAAIALGLLNEALKNRKGRKLPETVRRYAEEVAFPYTQEKVLEFSGVAPEGYEKLVKHLFLAQKPLVLGTGVGIYGTNSSSTNRAANLLNLILDPDLRLLDFHDRHRVEIAASRSEILELFTSVRNEAADLLLINNVNPVFAFPPGSEVKEALEKDTVFVVSFNNFPDETTELANLILPVALPLETWDEYSGKTRVISTLQPAMESLTGAPHLGDILLRTAFRGNKTADNYKEYLFANLAANEIIQDEKDWVQTVQRGGIFDFSSPKEFQTASPPIKIPSGSFAESLKPAALFPISSPAKAELVLIAVPSLRFFDGRDANKPWLCEIPDPLTKVAWQTPVLMHPETLQKYNVAQGDIILVRSKWGALEAPVYQTEGVRPGILAMAIGQGHKAYGRYAKGKGINPISILPPEPPADLGGAFFMADPVSISKTGRKAKLARTDGARIQHGRKIALSIDLEDLSHAETHAEHGFSMHEFPLALPLPEGYDPKRDFYPAHKHEDYRWAMVVDLDKCIGCGACAAACYAENNLPVVGEQRILEGREMSWLEIQRYEDPEHPEKITFLPMLCQHCDNAPCESVCPVFAPHHSKEGINNQIYNRCIGTRFCSQDCPYKVRRFNWFDWQWPKPLNLQLNPDVTVRSKGVMEKCSFCVQRIKEAHGWAKNENREIHDGEIQPACLQTCPTGVFTFGNLMDKESEVRKLVEDKRAYQVMGYLNTKPAVIYLKKVLQRI